MTAHVIIDPYRPIPNVTLDIELKEQGIDGKLWVAIHEPDSPVRSINKSHKMIVQYAKYANLPKICIMEEDVMFLAPGAWLHFLANEPERYDLYLGGCYGLNQFAYERIASTSGAVQIYSFAGLHCYIIHKNYYERFLSLPDDQHIDNQPGMGLFYVCSPFAALQHPGWSSNNRETVNYNRRLINEIPQNCLLSWEKIKENQ